MCIKSYDDLDKLISPLFSRRLRMLYSLDGNVVMWRDKVNTSNHERAFPIWEQDQLQDVLTHSVIKGAHYTGISKLNQGGVVFAQLGLLDKGLKPWFLEAFKDDCDHIPTWENAWLRIVMNVLYHKIWNGNEWVKA